MLNYNNIISNDKLNHDQFKKRLWRRFNIYKKNPVAYKTINKNKKIGSKSKYLMIKKYNKFNINNFKGYDKFIFKIQFKKRISAGGSLWS